jgi:hypothetical protein
MTTSTHSSEMLTVANEALSRQDAAALHDDLDRAVRDGLVAAALQLESAVTELIHDDELWVRLQSLDGLPSRLDAAQRDRFRAVLSRDLGTILAAHGYRPPPPVLQFRDDILRHLGTVLSDPGSPASEREVADARRSLIYLGHRLQPPVSELRRVMHATTNFLARIAPAITRVTVTAAVGGALDE